MPSTQFFATGDDLRTFFLHVEAKEQFIYTRTGHLRGRDVQTYTSGSGLPDLGKASADQAVSCDRYLISLPTTPILIRQIDATTGAIRTIDQLVNPDTITITLGGLFAPAVLIAGSLGTAHETAISRALVATWRRGMRTLWVNRNGILVGPGALKMLQASGRLTWSVSGPREFDLT